MPFFFFSFPWITTLKSQCSELSLSKQVLLQSMNMLIQKSSYQKTNYWDYNLVWIIHLLGRMSHKADHSKTSGDLNDQDYEWLERPELPAPSEENRLYSSLMHRNAEHWKHTGSPLALVRSNFWYRTEISFYVTEKILTKISSRG